MPVGWLPWKPPSASATSETPKMPAPITTKSRGVTGSRRKIAARLRIIKGSAAQSSVETLAEMWARPIRLSV